MWGGELKIRQAAEELGARGRRRHGGRGEQVAGAGDERVGVVGRRRRLPGPAVGRGAWASGADAGRGRCPEDGAELVEPADAAGVEGQRREQARRGGRRQRGRQRGQDAGVPRGAEHRREGAVGGVVRRRRRRGPGAHGPLDGREARGRGHGGGRREQQLGGEERLPQHAAAVGGGVVVSHVALVLRLRAGAREPLHERHEFAGLGVDDLGRRVVDVDGRAPGLRVVVVVVPRPPLPGRRRSPRGRGLLDGVRLHPDVEPGRARALQLPARRGGAPRRRRRVHRPLRPVQVLRVGGGGVGVDVAVVEEGGAGVGPGMGVVQHERRRKGAGAGGVRVS
jgi:hypothetical protein